MSKSIWDLVGQEVDVPCSNAKGDIQGVAKIRDETKLSGTMRVRLDFIEHIDPSVKDEMIRGLKRFVKKFYL